MLLPNRSPPQVCHSRQAPELCQPGYNEVHHYKGMRRETILHACGREAELATSTQRELQHLGA